MLQRPERVESTIEHARRLHVTLEHFEGWSTEYRRELEAKKASWEAEKSIMMDEKRNDARLILGLRGQLKKVMKEKETVSAQA